MENIKLGNPVGLTIFHKNEKKFQLYYFYGENETAIGTQVGCTLIAQLQILLLYIMELVNERYYMQKSKIPIYPNKQG